MKLFKRIVALAVTGTLLFTVAACGGGDKDIDTTEAADTTATAEETTAADDAATEDSDVKVATADDLKDAYIAAQRGTVGQYLAEDLVGEENIDNITTFEKYVDAVTALEQDKVLAIVMDERPAERFVNEREGLMIMPEPLSVESYAIAIKKGNTELVDEINGYLQEMKDDGSLQAIIDKYNSDVDVKAEDIDLNIGAAGGTIVMGTEAGFAPYELKVGDGYIGIDIEMMAVIAKKMDKELVIENMNFDSLPSAVNSGKIDCAVAGMTVTPEREENMDFSIPYVEDARQVILIKTENFTDEAK